MKMVNILVVLLALGILASPHSLGLFIKDAQTDSLGCCLARYAGHTGDNYVQGPQKVDVVSCKIFLTGSASPVKFEILRFAPKMLPESADGLRKLKLTYILQSSACVAHLLAYQRILQFILWRGFNFVLYK